MRWNATPVGSYRSVRHFAFVPYRLGDAVIWLRFYYTLQRFSRDWGFYDWEVVKQSLEPIPVPEWAANAKVNKP